MLPDESTERNGRGSSEDSPERRDDFPPDCGHGSDTETASIFAGPTPRSVKDILAAEASLAPPGPHYSPEPPQGRALSAEEADSATATIILEMFSLSGLATAFRDYQWSLDNEIGLLANIANDDQASNKDRMQAAKRLREIAERILSIRGMLHRYSLSGEVRPGMRGEVSGAHLRQGNERETAGLLQDLEAARDTAENVEELLEASNAHATTEETLDHDDLAGGVRRPPTHARAFDTTATEACDVEHWEGEDTEERPL